MTRVTVCIVSQQTEETNLRAVVAGARHDIISIISLMSNNAIKVRAFFFWSDLVQ